MSFKYDEYSQRICNSNSIMIGDPFLGNLSFMGTFYSFLRVFNEVFKINNAI